MALSATLYRIKMDLSDIDRKLYEDLEFRVAQHPSESKERLVARILAYALHYDEDLQFGRGVSDAEEAALWRRDLTGQLVEWIDVGAPSADRIHLATKKCPKVTIFAHKGEEALSREMQKRKLHRADKVQVQIVAPAFICELAEALTRNSSWTLVHMEGELNVTIDDKNFTGTVYNTSLPQPT